MVALPQYLTIEDYLQLEAESPIKHEYIDGQVYAMAGASDSHVTISLFPALLQVSKASSLLDTCSNPRYRH
ncbi:MAG: Uma2 family endonuclease [Leptolyngbyaceae cyanobacterium]